MVEHLKHSGKRLGPKLIRAVILIVAAAFLGFFVIVDESENVRWARITKYDTFSTNIKSIEYHDWEYDNN